MSIYENDNERIPSDSEACYEVVASQEEVYLEEEEEDLRAILVFCDESPSPSEEVVSEMVNDAEVQGARPIDEV